MARVFTKKLTKTDVDNRLSFPTKHLGILPQPAGDPSKPVEFLVSCGNEELMFRCIKRSKGPLKPVIESGWHKVASKYKVQPGDKLEFYMEASDDGATRYWIEIYRYEDDEMGTCRTALHI